MNYLVLSLLVSQTPLVPVVDSEVTFAAQSEQDFRHVEVIDGSVYAGGSTSMVDYNTGNTIPLPYHTTYIGPGVGGTNADNLYIIRMNLDLLPLSGLIAGSQCSDRAAYQIKPRGPGQGLDVCGMTHDGDTFPGIDPLAYQPDSQKPLGCGSNWWDAWNPNHTNGYCVTISSDLTTMSGGTLWGGFWGETTSRLQVVPLPGGGRISLGHTNEFSFNDLVGPTPYHSGGADWVDGMIMQWSHDNRTLVRSFYTPRGGSGTIEFPGGLVVLSNGDWLFSTTVGLSGQSGQVRFIRYEPVSGTEIWATNLSGQAMLESGAIQQSNGDVVSAVVDLDPAGEAFNNCRVVAVSESGSITWDRTFAGNGDVVCHKPEVLEDDSIIVIGQTTSTNLPVTDGTGGTLAALSTSRSGDRDGILIWLNSDGTDRYISYHGNSGVDRFRGSDYYDNYLYVTGWTTPTQNPEEADGWVLKFGPMFTTGGGTDGGVGDSGVPSDSGTDSGIDGGVDAGPEDAGFPDSGIEPDAGTPDGGFPLCYSSVAELCAAAATVCN